MDVTLSTKNYSKISKRKSILHTKQHETICSYSTRVNKQLRRIVTQTHLQEKIIVKKYHFIRLFKF